MDEFEEQRRQAAIKDIAETKEMLANGEISWEFYMLYLWRHNNPHYNSGASLAEWEKVTTDKEREFFKLIEYVYDEGFHDGWYSA